MKVIDLPPVWLALAAALVWGSRSVWMAGGPVIQGIGTALVALGVIIMGIAAVTMARARTTVIPHRKPQALVAHGIFGISRNPIYLGDVLVLTGLCLRWQAPLGLIVVPLFGWWIAHHFIRAEEARLRAVFGAKFTQYTTQVRRWL